jgi:hypothetical protein
MAIRNLEAVIKFGRWPWFLNPAASLHSKLQFQPEGMQDHSWKSGGFADVT